MPSAKIQVHLEPSKRVSSGAAKPAKKENLLSLRSGSDNFEIHFSTNLNFLNDPENGEHTISLRTSHRDPGFHEQRSGPRTWNAVMRKKTEAQQLKISEGYGNGLRAAVTIPLSEVTLLKYGPSDSTDSGDEAGEDYVLIFGLKPGKYFEVKEEYVRASWPVGEAYRNLAYFAFAMTTRVPRTSTSKGQYSNSPMIVDESRYVRIIIPKYKNITLAEKFSPELADIIIEASNAKECTEAPAAFYQQQLNTIEAEAAAAKAELDALERKQGVSARVIWLSGLTDRFGLAIKGPPNWQIPTQSQLRIVPTDPKANNSGIFNREPGPLMSGKCPQGAWQGTTYMKNGLICCSVDNALDPELRARLRVDAADDNAPWYGNIHVTIPQDDDDPFVKLVYDANTELNHVMSHELGIPSAARKASQLPGKDYMVKLHNIFLHDTAEANPTTPIRLVQGVDLAKDILNKESYQLSHRTHQSAIKKVLENLHSRTIIQGPPATGKTTMVAKIVCILVRHSVISNNIVVTAHTNEAVRVACTRTLDLLKALFKHPDPTSLVCLVTTESVQNYWTMTGKLLDPRVEACTLWSHLDRHAEKEPMKYSEFIAARKRMKASGVPLSSAGSKEKVNNQKHELIAQMKKTVKIYFATMSTVNLDNAVFGVRDGKTGVTKGVLIIDEASQATDMFVAMSILTTNPGALIFTGDHKQLDPHTKSEQAMRVWGKSLFERLLRRDGKQGIARTNQIVLGVQYRTNSKIYAGTNAHYDEGVETPPTGIDDRPLGKHILESIQRITIIDADQNQFPLTNIVHVFDLTNTFCGVNPTTGSSENHMEAQFIYAFLSALHEAGVSMNHIMVITGYQGQYDKVTNMMKWLPGHGIAFRKVDSAQGDEAELTIMSLVRTFILGPAFTRVMKRQNVAMSRAREAQFLVCDFKLIRDHNTNQAWQKWYNGLAKWNDNLLLSMKAPVDFYVDGTLVKPMAKTPAMTDNALRSYVVTESGSTITQRQIFPMTYTPGPSTSAQTTTSPASVSRSRSGTGTSQAGPVTSPGGAPSSARPRSGSVLSQSGSPGGITLPIRPRAGSTLSRASFSSQRPLSIGGMPTIESVISPSGSGSGSQMPAHRRTTSTQSVRQAATPGSASGRQMPTASSPPVASPPRRALTAKEIQRNNLQEAYETAQAKRKRETERIGRYLKRFPEDTKTLNDFKGYVFNNIVAKKSVSEQDKEKFCNMMHDRSILSSVIGAAEGQAEAESLASRLASL